MHSQMAPCDAACSFEVGAGRIYAFSKWRLLVAQLIARPGGQGMWPGAADSAAAVCGSVIVLRRLRGCAMLSFQLSAAGRGSTGML